VNELDDMAQASPALVGERLLIRTEHRLYSIRRAGNVRSSDGALESMAEFARTLVSRLRKFVGDRREVRRQRVRLAFSLSIASAKNLKGSRRTMSMDGHTFDLSANGLALIVPTITLGEHHLVGENRSLNIQLELPPGPVEAQVVPVRYERFEEDASETGYLIAVKIVGMSESDRSKYREYVSALLQRKR
jgi:hypothetical protein